MIPDLIKKQIRQGEGNGTAFKSNVRNLESIARTVCAFLNTMGGTVFCGVDEKGKFVGLTDKGKFVGGEDANELLQNIHAYLLARITPKALFTVNVDNEEGKSIVSIEIPEGKDRPYVFDGSVYVREGSRTNLANSDTLRNMIQTKSVSAERWERRPSMAMEESDLDRNEIRRTAQQAKESGRFEFDANSDDIQILQALAVYSAKGFTQAGDVLFAKNPTLRHPQTRVRVTRFASDKDGVAYLDDRMLQGPLVKVFDEAFEILSQHVRWEAHFQSGDVRRTDRPEYPFEALREGLVNAFAHRDYSGFSGGVTVGIYPSRIEIWNSGHFPEGLQPSDLKKNHPSLPTNPDIAHVFYLRGLMERIGRGGQLIINACQDYGLTAPKWIDRPTGVTLTIFGRTGHEAELLLTNPRQQALLVKLERGEQIRPSEYHQQFASEVSDRQARRDLVELEQAGLILRIGSGAKTVYQRTDRTWPVGNRT
jgi:ATP-dependent DNA helicase RecG